MNVTSALMDIAADPVTRRARRPRRSPTTPIAWKRSAARAPCSSTARARMACSALIDQLEQPITLEPFSKFPVVRDLAVDRSVLFENLKKVKAWVPVDGTYDLGAGPRQSAQDRKRPIRCRAASPAAAAWKPVRSSTRRPALSARPPSRRCGCLIASHGQSTEEAIACRR